MDIETFIKEGLKKIKILISEGSYEDALKGCEELLKIAPGEQKALKLYRKARDKIIKTNIAKVDKKIDEIDHLWKEENYSELLDAYTQLIEYAPEYRRLHKLLEKAQKKLIAQRSKQKEEIIAYYTSNIDKCIKEKKFDQARKFAKEFKEKAPNIEISTIYKKKVEDEYVRLELEKNRPILESEKYEDILLIYERLLSYAPWNQELLKKLQNVQKNFIYHQQDLELRMVKSGTLRIKILYNLGKYEECAKECLVNLRVNNKNKFAQEYLKKSKQRLRRIRDQKTIEIVKTAFKELRPVYEANKSAFIKI